MEKTECVTVGKSLRSKMGGGRLGRVKNAVVRYWPLYLMFLPAVVLFIIFNYLPMYGIVLAFKDFWPQLGILGVRGWIRFSETLRLCLLMKSFGR